MGAVAKGVLEVWAQNPQLNHKPIEGVTTEEYMRRYDTEKELEEIYKLDKLQGYTITVSGGTVNRIGENVNQNTIYVGEGS